MMAHKAMKQRHWERISTITSVTLDVESETFQLRQLMSAPLLPNKEDIEVQFLGDKSALSCVDGVRRLSLKILGEIVWVFSGKSLQK